MFWTGKDDGGEASRVTLAEDILEEYGSEWLKIKERIEN